MRDIPLFTTSNGVASLYLKKIPFTKEAFVHIRDSLSCRELVKECVDVCRMAGAERIFATGHDDLGQYPLFCTVMRYCISKDALEDTQAFALPTTQSQSYWWHRVYNQKMATVPTASPMSLSEVEELVREKKAYCIYLDFQAVGIGVAYDGQIFAVASASPGGGRDSVLALAEVLDTPEVFLSAASTNHRAINLYRAIGFREMAQEAVWYQIF